ncbi:hypothetical protein E1263_06785 [Kribbella antibiotica]|uniref:Carrier domain-containing protein n=1 Tax=Kribbella antibiotica TaxID=190195 RepID=A0A4R4ZUE3_9ACTN|nr:acyl-CoA dehydrogenase family protein [Kribbella antibiotica]TDD61589.1 hypothetical protein E1263_06785 [Kribbella antibiotica]
MNSSETSPNVLQELYAGRIRWELLTPFPEPDASGADAVAVLTALLDDHLDAEEVESSGRLPDGLLEKLQGAGLLRLMVDPELGGLGVSWYGACRVVEAAALRSVAVAFVLSIQNGFGSSVYLPALADGPLRTVIAAKVAAGIISAAADAEPAGAANQSRQTRAVPADGGYLLTGEKLFIGNGAVADFLDVSATLADGSVRLFFVDTSSPGFEVVARHEFMGLRGAPFGMLRLTDVWVPADQLMPESDDWRMRPEPGVHSDLGLRAALGRHLVIGPPALAIARLALEWVQEFAGRRTIDGRGLGSYEEIQRTAGEIAAEVYTIETVQLWCVLGTNTEHDLAAAKNITSLAAWRAIDRAVSVLGGEGYETSRSKAARGVPAHPAERYLRDARALRIAGGVDTMMDRWSQQSNQPTAVPAEPVGDSYLAVQVHRFAVTCHAHPTPTQRQSAVLGRLGGELLTLTLLTARQGTLVAEAAQQQSRHRIEQLWTTLTAELDDATNPTTELGRELLVERIVAQLWAEAFGQVEGDFFSLGGHSMVAVRLAAALRERLGVRVPVRVVLERPTVAELVQYLVHERA